MKLAFLAVAVLLAGCTSEPSAFERFMEHTPPCPPSGGTWILNHLEQDEVEHAQGALVARGYTNITTYGEAYPMDPPGGPYHAWTVIGQCPEAPA
jgi:hypothetical protein